MRKKISIVIPVYNEATVLPVTVPSVISSSSAFDPEIYYICNGCTDDSAELIRSLIPKEVNVIETTIASKSNALNLGDQYCTAFPRFFVDADVILNSDVLTCLCDALAEEIHFVAPKIRFSDNNISRNSKRILAIWTRLPYAQLDAFHHVLGFSKSARVRWERLPDVIADDSFLASRIEKHNKRIVTECYAETWAPRTFLGWAKTRARWAVGNQQLKDDGYFQTGRGNHLMELVKLLFSWRYFFPVIVYLANRFVALIYILNCRFSGFSWFSDRDLDPPKCNHTLRQTPPQKRE